MCVCVSESLSVCVVGAWVCLCEFECVFCPSVYVCILFCGCMTVCVCVSLDVLVCLCEYVPLCVSG